MENLKLDSKICKEEIVGVAYSGGGNRGSVHIGIMKAFIENKIVPTHIAGVSVGAFVGAFHAADPHSLSYFNLAKELLGEIGRDLFGLSIPQIIGKFLTQGTRVKSLGSLDKFESFMLKNLPFRTFEELKVPLVIGLTNEHNGQDSWVSKGDIIKPLLATASVPGMQAPVEIEGIHYIDGGATDNLPLFELARERCGTIYACNAGYGGQALRGPKNFLETMVAARELAHYQTERYEEELIRCKYPNIKIIHIEPRVGLDLPPYDFTPEKIDSVIEASYSKTKDILANSSV
ncbi:patatin-like phospholipase family protein [Patescibacteria group bacterium]|nr:patatin-like phospholipase family protein [Patescibacteria group bacterium]